MFSKNLLLFAASKELASVNQWKSLKPLSICQSLVYRELSQTYRLAHVGAQARHRSNLLKRMLSNKPYTMYVPIARTAAYVYTRILWKPSFLMQVLLRCGAAKNEPDRALDDRRQRCTIPSCGRKLSPLRRGHGTTAVSGLASLP